MKRRKEILQAYKEREIVGGIYMIKNNQTEQYLLGHAANLQSARNHFQFAVATGSTIHPRLQQDWQELGPQAFTFTVLEEITQQTGQSSAAFMDDLKTLEDMWRANLDASKAY